MELILEGTFRSNRATPVPASILYVYDRFLADKNYNIIDCGVWKWLDNRE